MLECIVLALLGAGLIVIGVLNTKGNISSLHYYHRKRVTEENRLPFGRLVGTGTIIIGAGMIVAGIFSLLSEVLEVALLLSIGIGIMITALVVGLVLNFYAMIKYNKGIF